MLNTILINKNLNKNLFKSSLKENNFNYTKYF